MVWHFDPSKVGSLTIWGEMVIDADCLNIMVVMVVNNQRLICLHMGLPQTSPNYASTMQSFNSYRFVPDGLRKRSIILKSQSTVDVLRLQIST